MIPKLFVSEQLEPLLDRLIEELDSEATDPIETKTLLVPNSQVRQWLLLEIARKKGVAMGLKCLEIEQLFPPAQNSLDLFCSIYSALGSSQEPELLSYLGGHKRKQFDLTKQLSPLFAKYGKYHRTLLGGERNWQKTLFQQVVLPQEFLVQEKIICFSIEDLPPVYWEWLSEAPALSIYLFSPCIEFWEDLCSDRERKKIDRYWKKKGVVKRSIDELNNYLQEGPRMLANWGKLGRETLRNLSPFDLETEELYRGIEPTTLLKQIQCDLLTFQETKEVKIDDSIQILQVGSSRLREIEALKEMILTMNIPYSDISVLAPDIEPYVPLIEYVFGKEIPYRISGVDLASQSSFRQGLMRLLHLSNGRWEAEEVLTLFETASFYKKRGWDEKTLELFRSWLTSQKIQWGFDAAHRKSVLQELFGEKEFVDQGSFEYGCNALLDCIVYYKPIDISPDLLEEFVAVIYDLKNLELKGEKTLCAWAEALEKTIETFLWIDPNCDPDTTQQNRWMSLFSNMKKSPLQTTYPIEVICHFLIRPCLGGLHSSQLHAVRFAPIEEGAMLPAKAIAMIGMDEMSFPRIDPPSSLDLLKGKAVHKADRDRYLFLRALFAAQKSLWISYRHLSEEEGKPVSPSLLVQELISTTSPEIVKSYSFAKEEEITPKTLIFPGIKKTDLPQGEWTLSIADLRSLARHPWRFFLQKAHQIFLDGELESSFALQRGKLLRAHPEREKYEPLLNELPGRFREAMDLEIVQRAARQKRLLEEWKIEPFSLILRENCKEATWEDKNYVTPPLILEWDQCKIKIVGKIEQISPEGIVSSQEDSLAGTLKIWPEALIGAAVFSAPKIGMLRSGKWKPFKDPQENLKAFIAYFFHCQNAPSPLLPQWADPILRKNGAGLSKKMRSDPFFEDPIADWVFVRAEMPKLDEWLESWNPLLKSTFQTVIDLYPLRGAHANI